jgi:predicted ArsR family transcriptional regulator
MGTNILLENYSIRKDVLSPIQNNLIKILQQSGAMTRKDLVGQLHTARTTIYDNLVKLQKRKVVEKFTRNNGNRGRPRVFWKLIE